MSELREVRTPVRPKWSAAGSSGVVLFHSAKVASSASSVSESDLPSSSPRLMTGMNALGAKPTVVAGFARRCARRAGFCCDDGPCNMSTFVSTTMVRAPRPSTRPISPSAWDDLTAGKRSSITHSASVSSLCRKSRVSRSDASATSFGMLTMPGRSKRSMSTRSAARISISILWSITTCMSLLFPPLCEINCCIFSATTSAKLRWPMS